MKILVIPSWHPTPEKPLWCQWVLPHINCLKENGQDVYVLQVDIVDSLKETPTQNSKVIYYDEKHIYSNVHIKHLKFYRNLYLYKKVLKQYSQKINDLYQAIEKDWGKPDIIHAHVSLPAGFGAAELGKSISVPVIVTEHYSGFLNDTKYFWRVGKFVHYLGKKIQGFYAVSPGFADQITKTGLIKVSGVLPNPINTEMFKPKQYDKTSSTFEIVTTGGLCKRKGVDVLFEALRLLIDKLDWRLTLFGNYDNSKDYSKWLNNKAFAQRVFFPGQIIQDKLVEKYANSDLYIVSSRVETANVSMLEAMSCGCPVLTTRINAPETLINDSVGISVPSENAKAMSQAIIKMAINQHKYDRNLLRKFVVENYSKNVVVKKMLKAYQDAIDRAE